MATCYVGSARFVGIESLETAKNEETGRIVEQELGLRLGLGSGLG
jgi:hypothetical protein